MKKFLVLVVLMLIAVWPAAAQQSLFPTSSHFTILDSSTGGFCYLTEPPPPTFVGGTPVQITIHGISIGQASGFGNVRVDHLQTVSFDQSGAGTISDASMVVAFTDGVDVPDTLTLSYTGTAAPPNAFGQGTMSGTFTVVSGTGRFAGMSGRGVWSGSVALQAPYPVFWGAPDFKRLVFGDYGPQVFSLDPTATPMCAMAGRMVGFLMNEGKNLK